MSQEFIQVALPLPVKKPFSYKVPPELKGKIGLGFRVLVPLGRTQVTGYVVEFGSKGYSKEIKEIIDLLDSAPSFSVEMLKLSQWISNYYLCSWGEVLRAALPKEMEIKGSLWVRLKKEKEGLSPLQEKIVKFLSKNEERISNLKRKLGEKNLHVEIYDLEKKGVVEVFLKKDLPKAKIQLEKWVKRVDTLEASQFLEKISLSSKKPTLKQVEILEILQKEKELPLAFLKKEEEIKTKELQRLADRGLIEIFEKEKLRDPLITFETKEPAKIILNQEQQNALSQIRAGLKKNEFRTFLLYGVTGSGKTQVYIEAIKECLALGKRALMLLPEISLTTQMVSLFKGVFKEKISCLHSGLSIGERFDTWRQIRNGNFSLVLGARSAIFAPLDNLGLVVVDEEHDPSYKQDEKAPRYQARDVAVMRGKFNNAVVLLGSATPSLESFYNVEKEKYTLLRLKQRVEKKPLPSVCIVNLKEERQNKNFSPFSQKLSFEIKERIKKSEQMILFLNRRGFSNFIKCADCGFIFHCPNCEISLTFHRLDFSLRCHYCDFKKPAPTICPSCQGNRFSYKGLGIQKIEQELKKEFPEINLIRMDQDTTSKKGSHYQILKDFEQKRKNLLLGTQMITKGLDFPEVTLVGVISADQSLDFPDFRSKERTFQLLTQVAGRAGRGEIGGEVVIQTYYPNDGAIEKAAMQDYLAFYKEEIEQRKELFYPPFSHLILLQFVGKEEKKVEKKAQEFFHSLSLLSKKNKITGLGLLGPAPAFLYKLRRSFRWQIIIKTKRINQTISLVEELLEKEKRGDSVKLLVNVDPMDLM
jgi:primosomal protein N' (replication factor Y)